MSGHDLAAEVKATFIGDRFLELVRDLGGRPKKTGVDWRCACFLHGGSGPNLVLTPDRGGVAVWHCMSTCGGGDVITLAQRALSLDFKTALEWLAGRAGLQRSDRFAEPASSSHAGAVARPRPASATPPASEGSNASNGAFLAALWCRVAESCWSAPVARWLSDVRGVEPDAAHALGCRDWSTVRRELADLLDETPVDELEAVGLARDGRLHPAVVGCFRGDPEWAAVAVPIWRFGRAYPERWRFRLVTPHTTRDGRTVKVFQPYSTALPVDFLGAGRPDRLDAPEVRLAHLGSGVDGAGLVVIVEGEPDLWSTTEVVDGRAVVLAVCGSPTRWREGWPSLHDLAALGVRRVAVCVHHGTRTKGRDGRVLGHGERFAEVVAGECAGAGIAVRRWLPSEGEDLNVLHRRRELSGFLAPLVSEATWATI